MTDFPALNAATGNRVRVISVEKSVEPSGIRLVIEHVDAEQAGRRHELVLGPPFRPGSLAAQLFEAAGISCAPGSRVAPKELVGRVVTAFFNVEGSAGAATVARFEPCTRSEATAGVTDLPSVAVSTSVEPRAATPSKSRC